MDAAAQAVLLQTDQILVKPINIPTLIDAMTEANNWSSPSRVTESVATILEYSSQSTVDAWFERVEKDKKLTTISMSHEQRVGHLPKSLIDLVNRLRSFSSLGSRELVSVAARSPPVSAGGIQLQCWSKSRGRCRSVSLKLAKKSGKHRFQRSSEWSHDNRGRGGLYEKSDAGRSRSGSSVCFGVAEAGHHHEKRGGATRGLWVS